MAGPTIRLTFAGDASNLVRALGTAGAATTTFQDRVNRASVATVKASAIMAAGVSAAAATAGLALAALPLAIGGLGIAVAAQNEAVKKSFTGLKDHVLVKLKELAQPFEPVLMGIATRAQETFDRIAPALGRMFVESAPMVDKFASGIMKLVENLMPGFEAAIKTAGPVVTALSDGLAGTGEALGQFFMNLSGGASGGATAVTMLFDAINTLLPILGTVIGFAAEWSGVLVPLALSIGGVAAVVRTVSAVTSAWAVISATATVATNVLSAAGRVLWLVMAANPIGLVITIIGALVAAIVIAYKNSETFRNIVNGAWNAVKNGIGSAVQWIGQRITELGNWFRDLPNKIRSAVGNLGNLLYNAGRDVLNGLWNGISAGWSWLTGKVSSLARGLLDTAKRALGISSPSKLFRAEVGYQLPAGAALGVDDGTPLAVRAMERFSDSLISPFQKSLARWGQAAADATGTVRFEDGSFIPRSEYNKRMGIDTKATTNLATTVQSSFRIIRYEDGTMSGTSALGRRLEADNARAAALADQLRRTGAQIRQYEDGSFRYLAEDGTWASGKNLLRRAGGGPVAQGRSYLVGENGPEMLTMSGNGYIASNSSMKQHYASAMRSGGSGGGGSTTVVNLYVQGSIRSDKDLVKIIRDEFSRGGFRGALNGAR